MQQEVIRHIEELEHDLEEKRERLRELAYDGSY
jgi:hypothetical protein